MEGGGYDPGETLGVDDIATMTGKHVRTVHLGFDIAGGREDSQPFKDLELTPRPDDELWVLMFRDKIDGERHYFVLNTEYRDAIVSFLSGVKTATVSDLRLITGDRPTG